MKKKIDQLALSIKRISLEMRIDIEMDLMAKTEVNECIIRTLIDEITALNKDGSYVFSDGQTADELVLFLKKIIRI